jgi:hypothetical protein
MIDLAAVSFAAAVACVATPDTARVFSQASTDSSYRATFEGGVGFATFIERAQRRKEQWESNYRNTAVPDALTTRARAAGGPWKLLVVAVDGCSDSVNTIPYIAKLVETIPGIELRIVDNEVGKAIMESHRTPDGRAATPTLILLDAGFEERGCFIERPAALRQWMTDRKAKSGDDGLFAGKMQWYDDDKGMQTMAEIVAILESAARGEKVCG